MNDRFFQTRNHAMKNNSQKPRLTTIDNISKAIQGQQAGSKTGYLVDVLTPFYWDMHITAAAYEADE